MKKILSDKNLSLKAKGLYCYIKYLQEQEVNINIELLHRQLKEGKDAIRNAIQELEENRYLKRELIRNNGYFAGYKYMIVRE